MKLHHLFAASALLLAACHAQPAPDDSAVADQGANAATDGAMAENDAAGSATPASTTPAKRSAEADALPPSSGLRFTGHWAADRESCVQRAWRFSENALHTPAGSVCRFSNVVPVPGGYDIAARCTAEGPETDDKIEIRFAESAQAMLFESDAIADAGLVYCGDGS